MKKNTWLILGFVALLALMFFFGIGARFGGHGYGMMGGLGFLPMGWFGMGIGMLLMGLIPLALLVLIILAIATLVNKIK